MHVLRNVHRSLRPQGRLLDIHPRQEDAPVRAGGRGLGFVEVKKFAPLVAHVEAVLDGAGAEGWLEPLRRVDREVVERYEEGRELLEAADDWENLRLSAATRRRILSSTPPVDVLWPVTFALFRKRAARRH